MLTAPYTSAMRLGQGFNTYNHEICVNDAVIVDPENPGGDQYGGDPDTVSQIVSYCTRHVEKVSQVTSAMNISAAASIKTQGFGGGLSGSYVDSDKFKESNVNFFCQVKVVNQVIMGKDLLKFNDIPTLRTRDTKKFTRVFGDSFISGFVEGGELNAIISVKSSDESSLKDIKAALEASFGKGGAGASGSIEAKFGLNSEKHISSTETTITVNWTGGGIIKPKEELWSIESLVKAAAAFPENVRHTPQRTQAILTKYENLRTYHMIEPALPPALNYDLADLYTNDLLDAFMDYKNIWKQIHTMSTAFEFEEVWLKQAPDMLKSSEREDTGPTADQRMVIANAAVGYMEKQNDEVMSHEDRVKAVLALLSKNANPKHSRGAFPATLKGLDKARFECRVEMGTILDEVSAIEADPTLAKSADPSTKFLNPALFRKRLPESTPRTAPAKAYDVAFYDSRRTLPYSIRTWQKGLQGQQTRDLTMTPYGGDVDINNDQGAFFQHVITGSGDQQTAIAPSAYISAIQVWQGDKFIRGIKVTYLDNKATPAEYGDCSEQGEASYTVPAGDKIVALNIHSAKKDPVTQHRSVCGFRVATRQLATHDFGITTLDKMPHDPEVWTTRIHHESWSLKGFWVQMVGNKSDGFIRMGGFYGKDEPI